MKRKKKTFSLTEIMISLAILAVAGLPMILMFSFSKRSQLTEEEYFNAMMIGQQYMEELTPRLYENPKAELKERSFSVGPDTYNISVKTEPDEKELGLYRAEISVNWKNKTDNNTKQMIFNTVFSRAYRMKKRIERTYAWDLKD